MKGLENKEWDFSDLPKNELRICYYYELLFHRGPKAHGKIPTSTLDIVKAKHHFCVVTGHKIP